MTVDPHERISAWRTALDAAIEREGDGLHDIPTIADPATSEGRAAILDAWLQGARRAAHLGWRALERRLHELGRDDARLFLATGVTTRELQQSVAAMLTAFRDSALATGDVSLASELYSELYKECFIPEALVGDWGSPKKRAFVLQRFASVVEEKVVPRENPAIAAVFYQEGLSLARRFLNTAVPTNDEREWALKLFTIAARNLVAQGDLASAAGLYLEGIALVPVFLGSDEPGEEILEWVLELFENAARNAISLGDREKAAGLYRDGLLRARVFLAAGEVSPGVRGGMLQLLTEGAKNEIDRGHHELAANLFHEGLSWSRAFLEIGPASEALQELILRTFVYAADHQSIRKDFQGASERYDEGLAQALAFLAAGQVSSPVREWALWLFSHAGDHRARQGDRPGAVEVYRRGFARARAFFAEGDSSVGMRDRLLELADAIECCEATPRTSRLRDTFATIAAAWLADTSEDPAIATSSAIRASIMVSATEILVNGVSWPRKSTDVDLIHRFPCSSVVFRGSFLSSAKLIPAAGVIKAAIRKRLLRRLEQASIDHELIEEFRAFLQSCMLDWHHQEFHDLFGTAVVVEHGELSPTETAVAALQGLLLWECMQANARTQALYREMRCLIAEVTRACQPWNVQRLIRRRVPPTKGSSGQPAPAIMRCESQQKTVSWRRRKPDAQALARRQASISDAPALWGRYRRLLEGTTPPGLVAWIVERYCEELDLGHCCTQWEMALLSAVMDAAAADEHRFQKPAQWLASSPPWQEAEHRDDFLGFLSAGISDRWTAQADAESVEIWSTATTTERVKQLDDLWVRVRLDAERLDRITNALKAGSGLDMLTPPIRRVSEPVIGAAALDPAQAFLSDLMAWQGIDERLSQEAELLLGALFVCELHRSSSGERQGGPEHSLIKQWQNAPPWRQSDAPTSLLPLSRAWSHVSRSPSRPAVALLKIPGQKNQPIRDWLKQLGALEQLDVDVVLLTRNRTVLDQALRQFDDSPDELVSLLDGAWKRAQRNAKRLALLKTVLESGKINAALLDALASAPDVTRREYRNALNAILRGRSHVYLSTAVKKHLAARAGQARFRSVLEVRWRGQVRRHLTEHVTKALDDTVKICPSDPLPNLISAVERAFAVAVHLHPGRSHESELTDRLHRWTLVALREAHERRDPEAVWRALESGRIALSGLSVLPPDVAWLRKTADNLRASLRLSVKGDREDLGWRRGWPPLGAWIGQCEELRGGTPSSWRACQSRLRQGEALVQPYFDPTSGALQALWLTAAGELELRRFANRSDDRTSEEIQWHEHILEPWALWLDTVLRDPSARVWRNPGVSGEPDPTASHRATWNEILSRAPILQFTETLAGWADAAEVTRLIVLFPAPLAQLPWESLPSSPLPPGWLVRAVSLSSWRKDGGSTLSSESTDHRDTSKSVIAHWTLYDAQGLDFAGLEAYCVDPRPYANSACTSVAVLAGFNGHPRAHVILHGRYQRFAPLRSGLSVHPDQFLPLWAIAAIGVDSSLLVLSACESNLSGRATTDLLGPVGIGPACIVAGAHAVLGTLWPCHDLATVGFIAHLRQLQGEPAWKASHFTIQVAEAARRLREMHGKEIRDLVERLAAAAGESFAKYEGPPWQDFYERLQPFGEPQYWAPYVVLGEPSGNRIHGSSVATEM